MQTNYYYLRQLTKRLESELLGLVLAECFSQERDELVMGFCTQGKQWRKHRQFYIRATIRPEFVCLAFPDDYRRASKNSVELFKELLDLEVIGVKQFLNDRCFAIQFQQGFSLLFKLHGNRSNLVLFQDETVIDLFHNKLKADNNLQLQLLDQPLDQSFEAFQATDNQVNKLFPTLGKEATQWLKAHTPAGEKTNWQTIQQLIQQLKTPTYYIKTIDYQPVLSLLKENGSIQKTFSDPLEAANELFYAYTRVNVFDKEKGLVIRVLQKKIQKSEAYLEGCYKKLASIEEGVKNEEIGHILMANLHEIPERAEGIELYDFYRDKTLKIKLKPDFSPQKNAELYYRKAKNEKIEGQYISENIANKEQEIANWQQQIKEIEAFDNLKLLRKYLKEQQLSPQEKVTVTLADQFKRYESEGYEIFVGRNAKNNDLLTQKFARKEDLWLHARDVSGSHVVLRHKAGKPFPKTVIERAASLAAYYSKRKNDTLCPVIVTPKKFVRKTKDLHEGQVIIEKEEVILVEPQG